MQYNYVYTLYIHVDHQGGCFARYMHSTHHVLVNGYNNYFILFEIFSCSEPSYYKSWKTSHKLADKTLGYSEAQY